MQVYNDATDSWYTAEDAKENLRLALAFSDELTAYYDRAPEDGGKVRIVVAK